MQCLEMQERGRAIGMLAAGETFLAIAQILQVPACTLTTFRWCSGPLSQNLYPLEQVWAFLKLKTGQLLNLPMTTVQLCQEIQCQWDVAAQSLSMLPGCLHAQQDQLVISNTGDHTSTEHTVQSAFEHETKLHI